MTIKIGIIDYGLGNLYSVAAACKKVGGVPTLVISGEDLTDYHGLILPGVGAFGSAMDSLKQSGLDQSICHYVQSGRPLLGICLGMQLLLSESQEFGLTKGLNLIPGLVSSIKNLTNNPASVKVPHIGWNTIKFRNADKPSSKLGGTLLRDLSLGAEYYFVHSFAVSPKDDTNIMAESIYEDCRFCSIIQKDNILGTQFHPEKSGLAGLTLYQNWVDFIKKI